MYIRQTDLFWGLNQNVVNRVMGIAQREAFAEGAVLFQQRRCGPDTCLYLSRVKSRSPWTKPATRYTPAAGWEKPSAWSSLIDFDTYAGSAICATPVVVLKLDRDRLLKLLGQ